MQVILVILFFAFILACIAMPAFLTLVLVNYLAAMGGAEFHVPITIWTVGAVTILYAIISAIFGRKD